MRFAASLAAALAALAALAVLIARYGIPNLVGSGQAFAGAHAVSSLRTVHWAQGHYRKTATRDEDRDGVGEFATLQALVDGSYLQFPGAELSGDVLSAMGYCLRVDLPEGADARERRFAAVAWPAAVGPVAPKLVCVDQDENLLERDAGPNVGCAAGPPAGVCPDPAALPQGWSRWKGKTSVKPVGAP